MHARSRDTHTNRVHTASAGTPGGGSHLVKVIFMLNRGDLGTHRLHKIVHDGRTIADVPSLGDRILTTRRGQVKFVWVERQGNLRKMRRERGR